MMKKIIILLTLAALLVACQGTPQRETFQFDKFVGKEGVVFGFLDRAPPDEVYEGGTFPIYLEFQNKGAQTATIDYTFTLDEKFFTISEKQGSLTLEGRSLYEPNGEKGLKEFSVTVRPILGKTKQTHPTFISTSICYPYTTLATTTVCMDTTDPLSTTKKVCTPKDISLPAGQGAPVGVGKITTTLQKVNKVVVPKFDIYIKNFQGGSILNKLRYADACRLATTSGQDLYNVIRIRAFLSDQELDCGNNPQGTILKWSPEKNKVTCSLKSGLKTGGTYPAPLQVVLDYGYTHTLTKKIMIQKS